MPFKKGESGNPKGRAKGHKIERTKQWEALADSICGEQADMFSKYIKKLWESDNEKKQALAADLYLKTVEYFKPKQSRVEGKLDSDTELVIRVIKE